MGGRPRVLTAIPSDRAPCSESGISGPRYDGQRPFGHRHRKTTPEELAIKYTVEVR